MKRISLRERSTFLNLTKLNLTQLNLTDKLSRQCLFGKKTASCAREFLNSKQLTNVSNHRFDRFVDVTHLFRLHLLMNNLAAATSNSDQEKTNIT